jgi:hypothetical protein
MKAAWQRKSSARASVLFAAALPHRHRGLDQFPHEAPVTVTGFPAWRSEATWLRWTQLACQALYARTDIFVRRCRRGAASAVAADGVSLGMPIRLAPTPFVNGGRIAGMPADPWLVYRAAPQPARRPCAIVDRFLSGAWR